MKTSHEITGIFVVILIGIFLCLPGCAGLDKSSVKRDLADVSATLAVVQSIDCNGEPNCMKMQAGASAAKIVVDNVNDRISK